MITLSLISPLPHTVCDSCLPIEEDWGWCLICKEKPYLLWVGCSGEISDVGIEWSIMITTEKPLFRNPFKVINTAEDVDRISSGLANIFASEKIVIYKDI